MRGTSLAAGLTFVSWSASMEMGTLDIFEDVMRADMRRRDA